MSNPRRKARYKAKQADQRLAKKIAQANAKYHAIIDNKPLPDREALEAVKRVAAKYAT